LIEKNARIKNRLVIEIYAERTLTIPYHVTSAFRF